MHDFSHSALPMRVRFGRGASRELAEELDLLGVRRVLVLSTPEQAEVARRVTSVLGDRVVGVHAGARMHVPLASARAARGEAERLGADACLAVGGGSTVGLGKAIALEFGTPVIAVPTTFAGSEMTPVWGMTIDGEKQTGRDPRVLPISVVYDPDLLATLPVDLCVTSGFNALAHAVEGLYAPDTSPIISLMAAEGARALVDGLPRIVADPVDVDARGDALYGAWLCGATLGATTMGLHHKLCHALGGTLNLPHAQTHTVVLPYVAAFNLAVAHDARTTLSRVLGVEDPAAHIQTVARELGAPRSLAALGMEHADIERITDQVMAKPYANPRVVTRDAVTNVLNAAWSGTDIQSIQEELL